uniref:Uncharacterized protein n=1 Tax=Desulfatirhabdium butyrativorans TaxID=340467 RepID=A0A7C4RQA8_9BACT
MPSQERKGQRQFVKSIDESGRQGGSTIQQGTGYRCLKSVGRSLACRMFSGFRIFKVHLRIGCGGIGIANGDERYG